MHRCKLCGRYADTDGRHMHLWLAHTIRCVDEALHRFFDWYWRN